MSESDRSDPDQSVLRGSAAFSGFSVADPATARAGCADVLEVEVRDADAGINRVGGPLIAWFADPAGNTLSVIEQS